jgi:hypothetical protein
MTDYRIHFNQQGKFSVAVYNSQGCAQETVASFNTPEEARKALAWFQAEDRRHAEMIIRMREETKDGIARLPRSMID